MMTLKLTYSRKKCVQTAKISQQRKIFIPPSDNKYKKYMNNKARRKRPQIRKIEKGYRY